MSTSRDIFMQQHEKKRGQCACFGYTFDVVPDLRVQAGAKRKLDNVIVIAVTVVKEIMNQKNFYDSKYASLPMSL